MKKTFLIAYLLCMTLGFSQEKKSLKHQLNLIEKRNSLLTDIIDIDYLETLYRTKFMVGKKNEKIYLK